MRFQEKCLYCNKELFGRIDKKFCDAACKSAHQYQKAKEAPNRFFDTVNNQLKLNRKILKEFNKGGKVTVRAQLLEDLNFNPNFFTHYWKTQQQDVYLFVYEFGFLKKKENGVTKYVLILWQPYMEKSVMLAN